MGNEIYMACAKCITEADSPYCLPESLSMQIIKTEQGGKIACQRHNMIIFEFKHNWENEVIQPFCGFYGEWQ